jgi:hypothetical protein
MYSGTGNTTSLVLGFPIRTSSDQRSVDSSPRLIAASYVLHRLSMPRHPPCALKHLQHKKPKMSKNCTSITRSNSPPPQGNEPLLRARCSQPLSTNQTPHPTTKWSGNKLTHQTAHAEMRLHRFPRRDEVNTGLLPQSPIVCLAATPKSRQCLSRTRTASTTDNSPSNESLKSPNSHRRGRAQVSWCSLERR